MKRRTALTTLAALPTGIGFAGCSARQPTCTDGYTVTLEPLDRAALFEQVVRAPPETVRTYTDYLLRLFARDPTTERRTLPSGIVDTTFLAVEDTYYQAVRTIEEVAGVEVTRTVTLPEGSPTPDVRYATLDRRDRAAFLAADSEGLLTDSTADTRAIVRNRDGDPLELTLRYPTTAVGGFQLTGPEAVLFAVNGAVLRLTRTDRAERTIRTFRIRFEPRGTTREAVIGRLLDTYGTKLPRTSLSPADRAFLDAAIDEPQTVCTDGSQASPATPTPAASMSLLKTLRDTMFVRYDGQWYDASVSNDQGAASA
ncbi:hypothetical protein [Halorubrum sodomense]|uniref:Uncharacterized protein n=1 Tax=Halorubrum sodomense TaxID=35743 RepID=A0A1I6G459_HALSD|nr:hypothetical protein [Halorubrum sodomense]SFR36976.1 hypothetical protein SAMN04487937_1599 [Halorubrum sodomense]